MTEIKIFENVSIVTFNNVSASDENDFICKIFEKAAEAKINIDMISQSPATSDKISFGFTFSDYDMPKLLAIINEISIKGMSSPYVNCGNIKFLIKSEEMILNVGYASRAFEALKSVDCLPLLLTTGCDEISILVHESDRVDLENALGKFFN